MANEEALTPDDALLSVVRRARDGPPGGEALEELDRLFRPRLLRYFSGTALAGEDPEDLVQKTLLAVFRNVERLEDPRRFLGWLFAIARNVRRDALEERNRHDRLEASVPAAAEPVSPGDREREEDRERRLAAMRAAIERLPARQRQCLLLRMRDGMPYEEIASILRLSANTVRNHLAQAREALRRDLTAREDRKEP
jgi:RNA polymerase sigma-70 factor (ECF subfamily)